MLELMGMDDVIAGEEKGREGKKMWGVGGWVGGQLKRGALGYTSSLRGSRNPSGPPAPWKGHRPAQPYILITKEPSL